MRKNIRILSRPDDYAKVDWFAKLLCTRIKKDVPFDANIIYQSGEQDHLPEKGINLVIPIRPATQEEISRVFDKVSTNTWIKRSGQNFILDIDIVRFAIWILSREEEYIQRNDPDAWDKHGRFKIEKSLSYQKGYWQKPVLDVLLAQLIERIKDELGTDILDRSPWGNGKSKAVWLTHDVDKLVGKYALPLRILGWMAFAIGELTRGNRKEAARWVTKSKQWLSVKSDPTYRSIKQIVHEEKVVGATSTFFFMSLIRGISVKEGIRYAINHPMTRKALKELRKVGCSIGLHPAYYKPHDGKHLKLQKENLEKSVAGKVHLFRNHYLRVRYPDTWYVGEKAGFRVSSNAGWTSAYNGFRSGTCWPYQPFDIKNNKGFDIIEVPIIYMDTILKNYEEIIHEISKLANEVFSVYGLLSINFHSDLWDEFETPYRRLAYKQILSKKEWHFINIKELEGFNSKIE